MQVDQATLSSYIGGEIEIQNQAEGYIFRGEIGEAYLDEARNEIVFFMAWMAQGEGYPPLPTGWVKSDRGTYEVSLLTYSASEIGDDRLSLQSAITGELAVIFPPNGSKLNQSEIKDDSNVV